MKTFPIPALVHRDTFRIIRVHFDNSKRQGRFGLRRYEAYGVVFPSGHVVLDSEDAPRQGYESERAMQEDLERYGTCETQKLALAEVK